MTPREMVNSLEKVPLKKLVSPRHSAWKREDQVCPITFLYCLVVNNPLCDLEEIDAGRIVETVSDVLDIKKTQIWACTYDYDRERNKRDGLSRVVSRLKKELL